MPEKPKINNIQLDINSTELDRFCQKLIKRSRDITKTHDSLITLETFIANFSGTSKGSEDYLAIETLIKSYTEQTRQQLLEKKTHELIQALKLHDLEQLTAIHTPLSRNGFYSILTQACQALTIDEIHQADNWCIHWLNNAKQKAEQASGYPDALDFKAAGIRIEDYQAMLDTARVLGTA